jgi:hypothetical protein
LQRVVPAEHCKNIADILNAAWLGFGDSLLWADIPQVRQKKDKVLKELVLKNLEVFEIEQIIADVP